jgi:hypothetical protein
MPKLPYNLNKISIKIGSIFNNFSTIDQNIMHPYSSRTFQWYQEHDKRHHDVE